MNLEYFTEAIWKQNVEEVARTLLAASSKIEDERHVLGKEALS